MPRSKLHDGRDFLKRNGFLVLLLAAAALVLVVCEFRLAGLAADDAFIHRRIALNYVQTGRAFFNPGERVMATSSPLWTVLLAASSFVLPIEKAVPWLEVVFVLLGAGAAYLLARKEVARDETPGDSWYGVVFPALAFLGVCVANLGTSVSQMETPCAIALMLTGCLGIQREKSWGMPLLFLACAVRYECVLLCVLAIVWVTVRRRWTKASLLSSAGVCLGCAAWLLWQYGTVIPNTIIAKSYAYHLSYEDVARDLLQPVGRGISCLGLGVLWCVFGRDRGRDRRQGRNSAGVLLAGFGAALALAYIARRTFLFPWYLPLIWAPLTVGVLLWTDRKSLARAGLGVVFAGVLLLPSARESGKLVVCAVRGTPGRVHNYGVAARVHEYQRIGAALNRECPSGTLMTAEIGGLGWGFHGKILDAIGLASPEAIPYQRMRAPGDGNVGQIPAGLVRDSHPDLIVSYDGFAKSALPAARGLGYADFTYPLFVREDRAEATDVWMLREMHVLVARDGRCSAAAVDQAVRPALEE